MILETSVKTDKFTTAIAKMFDYEFSGTTHFQTHDKPVLDKDFSIGLIVGSSGSGKSTLLKEYGIAKEIDWQQDLSIASHFTSIDDAVNKLSAVGLNSIPSWMKPFHVLSTGEQFRANLARTVESNCVIDEFTSVVNRDVAKSTATSISKYIKSNNLTNVVFASCHDDIIDWLEPDWVYHTDTKTLSRGSLWHRPRISLDIYSVSYKAWDMFKNHHYLSNDISKSSRCFLGLYNNNPIAFGSVLAMPNGNIKNAFRGHRTVILPDFQGQGLGVRFSDAIGEIMIAEGKRYFSRTIHPRMGFYRNNSVLWKPTSKNMKLRTDVKHQNVFNGHYADNKRICFSHEYIGKSVE